MLSSSHDQDLSEMPELPQQQYNLHRPFIHEWCVIASCCGRYLCHGVIISYTTWIPLKVTPQVSDTEQLYWPVCTTYLWSRWPTNHPRSLLKDERWAAPQTDQRHTDRELKTNYKVIYWLITPHYSALLTPQESLWVVPFDLHLYVDFNYRFSRI